MGYRRYYVTAIIEIDDKYDSDVDRTCTGERKPS